MKPYLESVRRLSRVALILLVLVVVASLIITMQYGMNEYLSSVPSFMQMFLPMIVYMFAGGIILALDGFSFLSKRADSDFYHSLPISRRRLFWSITLAALTWLAATVLAGVLVSVIVLTATHTPYVPYYALVAVPFLIVGGMLVFAAASIAMSLTGTWLSNIAMTLIVLGLPRFIQFVISRGILSRLSLMTWLDLPWYLAPISNIATGQIVTFTHNMLQTTLYTLPNIAYSLVLMLAELLIACLLFVRRPSEMAERNAKSAKVQTLYACLAIFPISVLFVSGAIRPTVTNILIVAAVVIALYTIYQIVVLRNSKKVVRSLPWALVPISLAVLVYFGIQIPVNLVKTDVPMIQDVAYVQFPGSDRTNGLVRYDEILVSKVRFTDQELKNYVLTSLRDNIASIDQFGYVNFRTNESYSSYEPVTIVLKNGRSIKRVLWFSSGNTLNALRDNNEEYAKAIRTLPPMDSICYQQTFDPYDPRFQEVKPLVQAYYDDVAKMGIIPSWMYNQRSENEDFSVNGKQTFGTVELNGYVGDRRYYEYNQIQLETPNACSAWMSWHNERATDEYYDILKQMCDRADRFTVPEEYINAEFSFYNVPLSNGNKQSSSIYYSRSATDKTELNSPFAPLANELIEILARSKPTTDPNSLSCFMTWSGRALDDAGEYIGADVIAKQQASNGDILGTDPNALYSTWGDTVYYGSDGNAIHYMSYGTVVSYNPSYRGFSPEDEARVVELLQEWKQLQKEVQFNYTFSDDSSEGADVGTSRVIAVTPTPAP